MHPVELHAPKPIDALLGGYAAGALTPALHALVAAHLEIRPENRGYVGALEALRADDIERAQPFPLSSRDRMLRAIYAESPADAAHAASLTRGAESVAAMPAALERFIGVKLGAVPWRSRLPGVREFQVEAANGGEATLYWIRAGRKMPSHSHDGSEVTLVLRGAFSDVTGRYARGDIAIADADLIHKPVAEEGEDCLCFAVTDAPLRLAGPLGRLVSMFSRH